MMRSTIGLEGSGVEISKSLALFVTMALCAHFVRGANEDLSIGSEFDLVTAATLVQACLYTLRLRLPNWESLRGCAM